MDEEATDAWSLSDSDSPDGMNQARFLFEEELDEMIIPETPRYGHPPKHPND